MLFDDEEVSGRRLSSRRKIDYRKPVLMVNASLREQKKERTYRTAVFVLVPTILIGGSVLLWVGIAKSAKLLFSANPRFTITRVDINGGGSMVSDFVRGKMAVREGNNLFSFDMDAVRREFLERAPNYRSLTITRRLPGVVAVDVVEREPLARIGTLGDLVVDEDGVVFRVRSRRSLPSIIGYKDSSLKPGREVRGMARAALQVLDACDNPMLGVRIASIDIGESSEYLALRLVDRKRVKLAWTNMGSEEADAKTFLLKQLGRLAKSLRSPEGRDRSSFDVTLDGRIVVR